MYVQVAAEGFAIKSSMRQKIQFVGSRPGSEKFLTSIQLFLSTSDSFSERSLMKQHDLHFFLNSKVF